MKKEKLIAIATSISMLLFLACVPKNSKLDGQNKKDKSIETFEIIALNLPDSVIFKPNKGVKIESEMLKVSLVSKTNAQQTGEFTVGGKLDLSSRNGKLVFYLTDETEVCAKKFNVPKDFETQKIKFLVGEKEMFYNITDSKWE